MRELVILSEYKDSSFKFCKDECSDSPADSEFLHSYSTPRADSRTLPEDQPTVVSKWKKSFVPVTIEEISKDIDVADDVKKLEKTTLESDLDLRIGQDPTTTMSPRSLSSTEQLVVKDYKRPEPEPKPHRQYHKRARYHGTNSQREPPRAPCRYCHTYHWSNGELTHSERL